MALQEPQGGPPHQRGFGGTCPHGGQTRLSQCLGTPEFNHLLNAQTPCTSPWPLEMPLAHVTRLHTCAHEDQIFVLQPERKGYR